MRTLSKTQIKSLRTQVLEGRLEKHCLGGIEGVTVYSIDREGEVVELAEMHHSLIPVRYVGPGTYYDALMVRKDGLHFIPEIQKMVSSIFASWL